MAFEGRGDMGGIKARGQAFLGLPRGRVAVQARLGSLLAKSSSTAPPPLLLLLLHHPKRSSSSSSSGHSEQQRQQQLQQGEASKTLLARCAMRYNHARSINSSPNDIQGCTN